MFVSRFHIVVGTIAFIDWLMWVDVQCGKFQFVYLPSYSFLRTSPVPKIKNISSSWVEHLVRRPNQSPEHLPQDQNLHWATRCKKCQSWLLLYVSVKKKNMRRIDGNGICKPPKNGVRLEFWNQNVGFSEAVWTDRCLGSGSSLFAFVVPPCSPPDQKKRR